MPYRIVLKRLIDIEYDDYGTYPVYEVRAIPMTYETRGLPLRLAARLNGESSDGDCYHYVASTTGRLTDSVYSEPGRPVTLGDDSGTPF